MQTKSLNGQWTLINKGRGINIAAAVPGDVYANLLSAGQIPDPFCRDNESELQWIGESDWIYCRSFTVSKEVLANANVLLRAEGLDTFARILLNDKLLAETDNMFRTYEWDVRNLLNSGRNTIRIEFTSTLPYIAEQQARYPGWSWNEYQVANPVWVRKSQCNYGWDWGPKLVTCGIWRSLHIVAFKEGRVSDVNIRQWHRMKVVDLDVDISVEGTWDANLQAEISVLDGADVVATAASEILRKKAQQTLTVKHPRLWWPNTMGKQPLYTVRVELKTPTGNVIDTVEKRIGLRTLALDRHDDEWGESFQFVVNGVPFFAKGSNWIPADAILARMTPVRYRGLVEDAAAANMNMLRVWGGGIYEDDRFYDACDELGICVWQDFMFACGAYQASDQKFMSNVKAEARDAIRRLRHHPCMALWCGNNELEMMNVGDEGWGTGKMSWEDYGKLFDKLLPEQVAELSPEIPYWPSSPHSPRGDRKNHRSHLCGDAHLWITSSHYPLACARGFEHRFASEFGFQSFPEPRTIETFAGAEDLNIASRIMELHQRAPNGNTTILGQLLRCFRMPVGFENMVYVSQIMAGVGVKSACEHFRRSMPRCMGTLYWQLNDCWPVVSWSSIDFHGRWKAMHYMVRECFAPVLLSGVEDRDAGTVEIHLTSDRLASKAATVSWTVTDPQGTPLEHGQTIVRTPVNGSKIVKTIRLHKILGTVKAHKLLVWLEAEIDGEPRQRNLVLFAPPKHVELNQDPGIDRSIARNSDGTFTIELTSGSVALWTWLAVDGCDAMFSTNFFHLRPGISETVTVTPARPLSVPQLRKRLIVRSLVDTYAAH